ncbi:PAX-interacting protein 1 [Pteropus alecto]|uniref:PAX-interacting protein 1 n=1 Tax=Pteropus alecto TaxID=9402 RepID=UPI000D532BCB|nr:PAX-interacting protein 1 [Pteropus alecto]
MSPPSVPPAVGAGAQLTPCNSGPLSTGSPPSHPGPAGSSSRTFSLGEAAHPRPSSPVSAPGAASPCPSALSLQDRCCLGAGSQQPHASLVIQLLKAGKAKEVSYNALASHIISEDGDNPEVGEAREVFDLPVVKPSWVTLSAQCGALLPVNGFSPESCQIFFGITACLSQVASDDRSALWALLTFYGGACQLHLDRTCTHLVVPEPKGEKYECALKRASLKVVTPDWVLDCVSEKTRKDEACYHPRLVVYEAAEDAGERDSQNEGSTDDKSSPASSRAGSPSGDRPFSPKPHAEPAKSELMFDDSSDSSPEKQDRNLNILQSLSAPTKNLEQQVNHNQQGHVNTSAVLFSQLKVTPEPHLSQQQPPPPPQHPVLHLPPPQVMQLQPPQAAVPPAAVTSLPAAAARPPASLPAAPAAVPAAAAAPPPPPQQLFGHDPALELPEEGFLLGCVFAIADYPEQMSDKQLLATWKRIIQVHGGAVDPTLSSRCTHLLCESQVSGVYAQAIRERKRCVTAHWLNTVLKKKKLVPPHRALHFPVAFPPGGKPCSQHIISVTGFVDSDRDDLKLMAYLAGAKYTGYLCRSNTVLICKEPTGLKYEKAREWRIPCVNAQWLGDILLGDFEALRQVQCSRYAAFGLPDPFAPTQRLVWSLLDAWRVPLTVPAELLTGIRPPPRLKQSEVTNTQPSSKRARIEDIPPPTKKLTPELTPSVLFTGFEPIQVQQYVKKLYILGGEIAESAQKCTHLIASKVTRTVKFLTAISVVKHVVTPEWLEECFKCQTFVDEQNYLLRDAEAEVLFSFSLEESLKRAHVSPLFKAKYFYITPGICPSLSTMKAIVECAGGKVLPKQPSFRKLMEHKQNKSLSEIILISCENDLHLCREYFARGIDVHNAEFVLTGVLTQTLDYESYKFN